MWVANAATVSPSADTADGRVHFTPANLVTQFHRALEADTTMRILDAIFADKSSFAVHAPLPAAPQFGDEGAANHMRLHASDRRGVEMFVYGRRAYAGGTAPSLRLGSAAPDECTSGCGHGGLRPSERRVNTRRRNRKARRPVFPVN